MANVPKYTEVISDIEGVFAQPMWTQNRIQTIPANFSGGGFADEFIRIEVLPNGPLTTYGSPGVRGQIILQIYTRAGEGVRRPMEIADLLDSFFQRVEFPNGTITETSALNFLGIDSDDNSLHRVDYTINFRHY